MIRPMLECVARAIAWEYFRRKRPVGVGTAEQQVALAVEMYWRGWLPSARAALAALRDPTPAMIAAGLDDYEFGGRTAEHVIADWHAMVDCAAASGVTAEVAGASK